MSNRFATRRISAPLPATLSILLLSCGDGPAADAAADIALAPATEDVYTVGEYGGEDWENFTRPDGRIVTRGGVRMVRPDQESEEEVDPHLRDIDLFALGDSGKEVLYRASGKEVLYRAWGMELPELDEELVAENEDGRRVISFEMPRMRAFEPGLHLGMLSDGRLAVVDSMGYRVKLIGLDGTVVGAVERPIAPEPVTEAIMAAERERRREAFEELTEIQIEGFVLEGLGEQMRDYQLAQVDNMVFTEVIPVIADMAVDAEDLIWVERTGPGGDGAGPIDILTAEGDYIGTLPADGPRIPDAFGPDGLMAYIETDELDVPVVRVIRLAGIESPG